jgi:hypothetical protein
MDADDDNEVITFDISEIDWDALDEREYLEEKAKRETPLGAAIQEASEVCCFPLSEEENWLFDQEFPIWLGFTEARQETRLEFRELAKDMSARHYERHVYYCFDDGTTRHFHGGEEVTMDSKEAN